ncbi:MAG: flagellar FlbD family protein [Alphaproteobacteria bacterium]
MIEVTQLNGEKVVVNADLIETIEAAHHTIVTLTTKRKLLLKESVADIVNAVIAFRQRVAQLGPQALVKAPDTSERS